MVNLGRWLTHLFSAPWAWRRAFPASTLDAIERAIGDAERHHRGEIRFVIENHLAPFHVWRGVTARARAMDVFSHLRVWDTEHNSGVLIYVLLADRDIEIVADRGAAARIPQETWEAVAQTMEAAFRRAEFEAGALAGIARVGALLAQHFPARGEEGSNPDELANRPAVL